MKQEKIILTRIGKSIFLSILCMFIIIASGYAFDMTPEQIRELIERTDKNSAPEQYESYVILMNYKPGDKKTEQKGLDAIFDTGYHYYCKKCKELM